MTIIIDLPMHCQPSLLPLLLIMICMCRLCPHLQCTGRCGHCREHIHRFRLLRVTAHIQASVYITGCQQGMKNYKHLVEHSIPHHLWHAVAASQLYRKHTKLTWNARKLQLAKKPPTAWSKVPAPTQRMLSTTRRHLPALRKQHDATVPPQNATHATCRTAVGTLHAAVDIILTPQRELVLTCKSQQPKANCAYLNSHQVLSGHPLPKNPPAATQTADMCPQNYHSLQLDSCTCNTHWTVGD